MIGYLRRLHDSAYATTWGWSLPDWPHYRRPLIRDPWFLGSTLLGVLFGTVFAFEGQDVPAVLAPISLLLAGGNARRAWKGIDERDKAYRVRQRLERGELGSN